MNQSNKNPDTAENDTGVHMTNTKDTKGTNVTTMTAITTDTPVQIDYFNITKLPDHRDSLMLQLNFLGHDFTTPLELQMLHVRKGALSGAKMARCLVPDADAAVAACVQADKWYPQGTYLVMNQPDLEKQESYGTNREWDYASNGTVKDPEITYRRAVYFDFDPKKPKDHENDSATSEERRRAREASKPLFDDLNAKHPNSVAFGSSGNGAQIWLALDNLTESPELAQMIARLLHAAKRLFQSPNAKIDTSVCDARRIV